MTTYTFQANPSTQFVNWDDPSVWIGGVVPNGTDADVVIPFATIGNGPIAYGSYIAIRAAEAYTVRSLSGTGGDVELTGALTILGAWSGGVEMQGGALSITRLPANFYLQGTGSITSADALTNTGEINGTNATGLTVTAPSLVNDGTFSGILDAATVTNNGTFFGTLNTAPGGFTNLSGTTLTGGTYGPTTFDVGGVIVTDAATIDAGTGTVQSFDPTTQAYVPLEQTLRTVTTAGTLSIVGPYTTSSLDVAGKLVMGSTFTANSLTIDASGSVTGSGTVTATTIVNDGIIEATAATLTIKGSVSGTGSLLVGPGTGGVTAKGYPYRNDMILELDGATARNVAFTNQYGTLTLGQVATFTGAIQPFQGDIIDLTGIAANSVTGSSFAPDATGGILTIDENGTSVSLRFDERLEDPGFTFAAGPQALSTSPPSLAITVTNSVHTGTAFYVDGSQGIQDFVGSASNPSFNFIDTATAAGSGAVVVDLANGLVSKGGQLDATLSNIQGVQLGADPSTVLGSGYGIDLLYGGSGADTFYGGGETEYIQGGTGTNAIIGAYGNEVFYGTGGADTMLGGTLDNFMQAGPTAGSSDTFYGNGGADYIDGGPGTTTVFGGAGYEQLTGSTAAPGFDALYGSAGTDVFYAGIGTNLFYEGSGTDAFAGNSGTDVIYGGSGQSFIYGGSGTDVVTTGAGNQYVQAGTGQTFFNDTAAHLTAGRFDQIDNFAGGQGINLYLPSAVHGATTFAAVNGGTAVLTAVNGGTAEIFASNTPVATVQAHTHFTL